MFFLRFKSFINILNKIFTNQSNVQDIITSDNAF